MSYFTYIAFSRELNVFRFSDIKGREKDYGIYYDTTNFRKDILLFPNISPNENHIVLVDKKEATFNNCFKNPFIYEYHIYQPLDYNYKRAIIANSDLNEEIKERELKKIADNDWLLDKQVQYDFIIKHLNIGEFVEIYTELIHDTNFNLGPPLSECTINLDEFMNLPRPEETINKHKMTIYFRETDLKRSV